MTVGQALALQLTKNHPGMVFTSLHYIFPASHNIGKRLSAYGLVPFLDDEYYQSQTIRPLEMLSADRHGLCVSTHLKMLGRAMLEINAFLITDRVQISK